VTVLDGERVLVTGAASGIGFATVVAARAAGASVAALDLTDPCAPDGSLRHHAGPELIGFEADVRDAAAIEDAVSATVARLGGLTAVVHAAGVMGAQAVPVDDVALDDWERVVTVNLTGAFLVARAAARAMRPAGRGTIVLVGSRAGVDEPSGSVPYGASKGGVYGLAMTLAAQLGPAGLRVHALLPGPLVDTSLARASIQAAIEAGGDEAALAERLARATAPAEVAATVVHVLSPAAAGLRGTIRTA
jgi:NAD(P)-dependent dehydrogenase (short-subunit alcohol dehydrogenase family)